jgi:esterase/lipase superfamily enzyme
LPLQHAIGELEGPSIWNLEFQQNPSRHVILEEVQVQSEQTFLADVRASLASSRNRELVIWIHGFNVSFDQAMHRGAQVHHDVRFEGVWVTYSWPAPKNYVECEGNAVWTVPHLLETLELLTARSGAKRIHVVAHGMGCRVALSAVSELGVKGKRVLSQVVLCAPDIDAAVFWQQVAPRLPNVAERTVILVSSNDWALVAASKAHGYRRVGTDTSKRSMIPGIDTIDVSDRGTGLLGHSYYGDSPTILEDIRRILAGQPLSANAP